MALTPDQFNQFMANPAVRDAFMRDVLLGQKQQATEQEMTLRDQEAQRQEEAHKAQMEMQRIQNTEAQHKLDLADVLQTSTGDMNAWIAPQQFNGQANPYRVEFSKTPAEYQQHWQDAYGNKRSIADIAQEHNQRVQSLTGDYSIGAPQGLSPLSATMGKDGMQVQYSAKDPNQFKPTESQQKAQEFLRGMQESEGVMEELEKKGYDPTGMSGMVANRVPSFMQGEDRQRYNTAAMRFSEMLLRRLTGANAPQKEVERNAIMFFAQPGDSPKTAADKKAARLQWMEALKTTAHPTYSSPAEVPFLPPSVAQVDQRQQAIDWLRANPNHPKAAAVRAKLGL